ncbi:M15 family metallopeptidase [Deinococcus fonticola]|uniref:M15 family metallopeptidase n=1 Tax=Deinococcus fonticola TaxID=2528713 RepID=UPI0010751797|nr:M15 family metallopeptidase [Deinococcus fonticola]
MGFDFNAAIRARPGGMTRADLVNFYGDPLAGSTPGSRRGTFEPGAAFRQNIVSIPISELPGFPAYADPSVKVTRITLHRKIEPIFRATWAVLHDAGLADRLRTYDGATTYRHMLWNPSNPISLHAYGAAIDFDARWNGYGISRSQMQIDREVIEVFERCGWTWGGRWNPSDGMHLQWTDPVGGERSPVQDALAKEVPQKPTPAPASATPMLLVPDGKGGWVNMAGKKVEGQFSVINATDPLRVWAR